ncbi:ring finger membrane protein [Stylonychia lemnae]|uniref:Ring finger membrane protein n=1 Tax=Stylonychia lemnae TaxID=5949 RepID=A0A078AX66_STYLE|nr:ring finger membrane protein [Stylonychia lemnae]|eukprot:CDW86661.1 ring finger membrane protein [Stylonychia lemnae]
MKGNPNNIQNSNEKKPAIFSNLNQNLLSVSNHSSNTRSNISNNAPASNVHKLNTQTSNLSATRMHRLPICSSFPCNVSKLETNDISPRKVEVPQTRRNSTQDDSSAIQCRICFLKDLSLISPCLCKGSLKFVHEECLIHWLQASHRKKCELCGTPFYIYKGRSSIMEIINRTLKHFKEDKSRLFRLLIYIIYLWLLKNRLFSLIRVYYNLVNYAGLLTSYRGVQSNKKYNTVSQGGQYKAEGAGIGNGMLQSNSYRITEASRSRASSFYSGRQ